MEVVRGEDFEVCWESGETGQEGTVALMLIDNVGGTVWVFSTADIIETPAGSGNYCATRTAPLVLGHYTVIFSIDGTLDENSISTTDLYVIASGAPSFPPLAPGDSDGPGAGPCFAWASVEDVAECCSVEVGSTPELFEDALTSASQVLYALSARQWTGSCERVVRAGIDFPCGLQVLSRGHLIGWEGALPTSRVLLPNYPVTAITQVRVDGDVLAADEYRLDGWRWLTRMADSDGNAQIWPSWGRDDLPATEEHTFEISYTFGTNPPRPGVDAAIQLACEIYKACPGNEGVAADGECKIPQRAVRVTRQGVTLELGSLHYDSSKKKWETGMKLVDLFLNTYNPKGLTRGPMIWSADDPHFAHEVGTALGS